MELERIFIGDLLKVPFGSLQVGQDNDKSSLETWNALSTELNRLVLILPPSYAECVIDFRRVIVHAW
jgi:hypothetical protein